MRYNTKNTAVINRIAGRFAARFDGRVDATGMGVVRANLIPALPILRMSGLNTGHWHESHLMGHGALSTGLSALKAGGTSKSVKRWQLSKERSCLEQTFQQPTPCQRYSRPVPSQLSAISG